MIWLKYLGSILVVIGMAVSAFLWVGDVNAKVERVSSIEDKVDAIYWHLIGEDEDGNGN